MTILIVWAIVTSSIHRPDHWGWKALVEVNTPAACHRAASALGIDPKQYRCIDKQTGETR